MVSALTWRQQLLLPVSPLARAPLAVLVKLVGRLLCADAQK